MWPRENLQSPNRGATDELQRIAHVRTYARYRLCHRDAPWVRCMCSTSAVHVSGWKCPLLQEYVHCMGRRGTGSMLTAPSPKELGRCRCPVHQSVDAGERGSSKAFCLGGPCRPGPWAIRQSCISVTVGKRCSRAHRVRKAVLETIPLTCDLQARRAGRIRGRQLAVRNKQRTTAGRATGACRDRSDPRARHWTTFGTAIVQMANSVCAPPCRRTKQPAGTRWPQEK
jgi:hypothetical protein